jgi:hypothetical protein
MADKKYKPVTVGEPYAFCGRIVEAFYTNPELDTVGILWQDDDKVLREYYVVVDENDDQFKNLLLEFSYDSIDEATRNRNEATRSEFREAFHRYATENNLYTHGDKDFVTNEDGTRIIPTADEIMPSVDIVFEYNEEDEVQKESLFKLKLKMFEQPVIQSSKAKVKKAAIRKAKTPLEALVAYSAFIK